MMPTMNTADVGRHDHAAQRDHAGDQRDDAERRRSIPIWRAARRMPSARLCGPGIVSGRHGRPPLCGTAPPECHAPAAGTAAISVCDNAGMNDTPKKEPPPAAAGDDRPAAAPVQARRRRPRRSKSSWWCATTRSTPSPARWSSPAASSRTPTAIRGCARAAAAPTRCSDDELKFRVAGVREAFEECGVLLARKRGQRALIARGRPQGHRGALARQARQGRGEHRRSGRSRGSRDRHRPDDAVRALDHADLRAQALRHLVLPGRGAARTRSRCMTDRSSVELGVDRRAGRRSTRRRPASARWSMPRPRTSSCWPRAGRWPARSARRASARSSRSSPGSRQRDGKRFLHIPEGAGYRNLFREMPPQPGFRRPDGSSVCPVRAGALRAE